MRAAPWSARTLVNAFSGGIATKKLRGHEDSVQVNVDCLLLLKKRKRRRIGSVNSIRYFRSMKKRIPMLLISLASTISAQTNAVSSLQGLSFYKPNYALIGNDPILEMKLQFSFKYQLVTDEAFENWWSAPLNHLFVGYTQKMFWDLEEDSAPYPNNYLDSYFSPELFWLKPDLSESFGNARFDLQFGYQHESNGRDEVFGRTWERIYLQPFWIWGEDGDYQFSASPKIWAPFAVGDFMDDIADFYGYGELYLKWGKDDGFMVDTLLRKGMKDWYGAVELNASYPIHRVNLYLQGQVFYGYGESLRLYNQESTTYRIGFALSR